MTLACFSALSTQHSALIFLLLGAAAVAQDPNPGQDDDTRKRLIKRIRGRGEDDVMVRIIRQMAVCQTKLGDSFDVGTKTQATQRRILEELDLAIQQAKDNMRIARASSAQAGDPRGEGQVRSEGTTEGQQGSSGQEPASAGAAGARGRTDAVRAGELRERLRQWGSLPPRDRAEILQGLHEEALDKYREEIERYYEALAKPEE